MFTRGARGRSAVTSASVSKRVVPALPVPLSFTKKTRSMTAPAPPPNAVAQSRPTGSR